MAATPKLFVRFAWKSEPGEGEPCQACGDAAYLIQVRLYVAFCDGPFEPGNKMVCAACANALGLTVEGGGDGD